MLLGVSFLYIIKGWGSVFTFPRGGFGQGLVLEAVWRLLLKTDRATDPKKAVLQTLSVFYFILSDSSTPNFSI